jgi:type VI secretion system secreted protein Hcp
VAVDAFLQLVPYNSPPITSESQVVVDFRDPLPGRPPIKGPGALFEIEDYSFDVEQTLNIGSQSTGAGAGKVTFNPFSVTRKIDKVSPTLFKMACAGTPFQSVDLFLRKSAGGTTAGQFYLVFGFNLVAVKTISWSHDDETPKEVVTFEYGALSIAYAAQKSDGTFSPFTATCWDRVKNMAVPLS